MIHPEKRCPPGSLAWQQYEVNLMSGRAVTLAFSLGDPRDETMARVKERHRASHLGLLVVLDDPDSAEEVVLWFHQAQSLTLLSQNGEIIILGEEVTALLPRYFAVFFDDVKALAPELAYARLSLPCRLPIGNTLTPFRPMTYCEINRTAKGKEPRVWLRVADPRAHSSV
jgi:hypothetical protein